MIRSLAISNFKCFDSLNVTFGKLTLLTGFNGGGKSSAIQPLLLLAQSRASMSDDVSYTLNGPLVRLGTFGDVLPSHATDAHISFAIDSDELRASWLLTAKSGDRLLTQRSSSSSSINALKSLYGLTYVSAVRGSTSDTYPMPDEFTSARNGVGIDGRFAAFWYDRFVDDEVPLARRHPNEPATSFRKQLDAWLGALFRGAQANVQLVPQSSELLLQFRMSDSGEWRRPANTGYGLTYAFPILVALLSAADGDIVVVDSPEAHLHPSAQSEMGKILASFAAAGVQTIVESHSDHVLNGARLAVKDTLLAMADFRVHFFTGANTAGHGVISPRIDEKGSLDAWPDGFFDQTDKDLGQLAGWI